MNRCPECSCFIPTQAKACPDCDVVVSPLWRAAKGLAMLGASAATAMTLMACYGTPYDDIDCVDNDSDGYCGITGDCNDNDFEIRPGAVDSLGDGIDQNCDGADGIAMSGDAGVGDSGPSSGPDTGM